jgi:hypothetical protein
VHPFDRVFDPDGYVPRIVEDNLGSHASGKDIERVQPRKVVKNEVHDSGGACSAQQGVARKMWHPCERQPPVVAHDGRQGHPPAQERVRKEVYDSKCGCHGIFATSFRYLLTISGALAHLILSVSAKTRESA